MNLALALYLVALSLAPQERRPVLVDVEPPAGLRLELHDAGRIVGLTELERAVADLAARGPARTAADAQLEFDALERRRAQFEAQRAGLLAALREGMQPPADDTTRVEWLPGGHLAVLAEPAQHAWVRAWLAEPLALDGLFDVSTVLWSLPAGEEASALARRNRERLGAAEAQRLVALLADLCAERITAPRVLGFAFAPTELRAGSELAYLSDWEQLELTDRAGTIAVPVVSKLFEGFEMRSTCFPTLAGRVRLDVDLSHTRLQRPIVSHETTFGRLPEPVVVQLPQWTQLRVSGSVDLASDEALLLAAEDPSDGAVVLALLRVRAVAAHETR